MISKDHKQFFSQYKYLKDRFEMIAQVCEISKCFRKELTKKTLEKKLLDKYVKRRKKTKIPKA